MSDSRGDPLARRAAAQLRGEPVDEQAIERVIAALQTEKAAAAEEPAPAVESRPARELAIERSAPAPRTGHFVFPGWPALAAAAVIFAIGLGVGASLRAPRDTASVASGGGRTSDTRLVADDGGRSGSESRTIEFVFVAPRAVHVSLVGEFNGWDASATPMRHTERGDGTWSVSVPLGAGRHVYAFVIDDSTWVPDPQAPLAPEQWYGQRNSVIVVPGGPRS